MSNHWIQRRFVGVVRYTNMVLQQDIYQLPVKFTIESGKNNVFRCSRKNLHLGGPNLTWLSREVFEVGGKQYKLKYSPAYSVPCGDYVFTGV